MAKAVFLSGFGSFGGTVIYVTNLDYNESTKIIDATDLSTPLGQTDNVSDTKKGTFTLEAWKDLAVALPARGTEVAIILDLESYRFTGNGIINNVAVNGVFDTAIRLVISGLFNGTITEVVV